MELIVASIKGAIIGLYILPGNRRAWPCVRYQSTGTGKQLSTGITATRVVSLTNKNYLTKGDTVV